MDINILIKAYALHNLTMQVLANKICALEEENQRLKALLKLTQQERFGKKSEAFIDEKNNEQQTIRVSAHTRKEKKSGRLLNLEHLPVYQKIYDLAEHEKNCSTCQQGLHVISKLITKQLEIIPVRYCVVEHLQIKYGCRRCETIQTALKPLAPIPKAMAGSSLLAEIIVNKYQAHQPLYRQSKMMKQEGIHLPDNTLGNWVVTIGCGLELIYECLWVILKQRYLQVDETPVKILEPDKKGYLWTYYAPHVGDKRGIVVFELSETRSGRVAEKRLAPFTGLLQTDAYQGYQELRKREGIVGLGCFSHARRKFAEVVKITGDKNGIAAQMLEKLKPLYALEERMRQMKVTFHTRKRLRQKIARPILKDIHRWLRLVKPSVPPKSKLGEAIHYTLKQWRYLVAYLRHGMAEIDTNGVENKIREIAIGKKNWLFIGNPHSGKIHAIFFSLFICCILNEINPRLYIHYLITRLHDLRQAKVDPMTLLPHTIDLNLLTQFATEQIDFAKKIFNSS